MGPTIKVWLFGRWVDCEYLGRSDEWYAVLVKDHETPPQDVSRYQVVRLASISNAYRKMVS